MSGFQFEKALKMLIEHFPEEAQKKPIIFHSIRVWSYLWSHNYSEDIQIAWLLHDALEDTDISPAMIEEEFGTHVVTLVQANTKNMNLEKSARLEDIVRRCNQVGEDALIVKLADVYDNFLYYTRENNLPEIERCKSFARLIQKYKNEKYTDTIFDRIDEILI